MKKIIYFTIIFFIFITNIKASVTEVPVVITLNENFFSTITRTYSNGLTTINYTNNLPTMDLTDAQLKTILSQKPGEGSSRLTYYETLKIKINPIEGTNYYSLRGKSKYYRANDGGAWINANLNNYTSDMDTVAIENDLTNYFWPWGFKLQYRLNTNDSFTSNTPSGKDLSNKTLEQQLATIFDIDLTSNPNGVIDLYPDKIRFNPLPEGYNFRIRFDFFDTKSGTTPTLMPSSTTEYDVDSLKHLGTEYVIIKYNKTTTSTTIKYDNFNNEVEINQDKIKISYIVIPTIIIILASLSYYLYKKNRVKLY